MNRLQKFAQRMLGVETRASPENPSTLMNPASWLVDLMNGQPLKSGVRITNQSSLTLPAVWACVNVIASTLASLPLILYSRRGANRFRAFDDPLYPILHDQPNEFYSSYTYRETSMGHVLTWGNWYSEIIRRGGRVVELQIIRPDWITPDVTLSGRLFYDYQPGSGIQARTIAPSDMIHVPGLGFDGVKGYSVIETHREMLGGAKARVEYGATYFGNGSRPSGVLEHPGKLKTDDAKNLRQQWEGLHAGSDNWNKTAILENGMTWKAMGLPPEDAQFIESRTFDVSDVARMYNMPPHMIQEMSHATFSNIEHQSLNFVMHTIRPWVVRVEQELNRKLIPAADRQNKFFEFLVDGLLRGDMASRSAFYANGRQWGYLSVNDIRRIENLNPIKEGNIYLQPANMVPAGTKPALPTPPPGGDDE